MNHSSFTPAPHRQLSVRPPDPTVSVVLPAMNEAENLPIVVPQIDPEYELILVDGASSDDTVQVAKELRPDVQVVQQTRKGKGNAVVCGFEHAQTDIVVMLDADGSTDPTEIPRFVEALRSGGDFAKGTRFATGGGSVDITGIRQLGNAGLNTAANLMFGTGFSDLCYGYNAMWRDIIPYLDLPPAHLSEARPGAISNARSTRATVRSGHGEPLLNTEPEPMMLWGDGFEIETLLNCRVAAAGFNIVEVPSLELERVHGESNLNATSDGLRVLRTIWSERRRASNRWAHDSSPTPGSEPDGLRDDL